MIKTLNPSHSRPKLAALLNRVNPSPTVALTGRVADMKAQGHKIIGLGAGEPDFDVPMHIKEAAIRAVTENRNIYTPSTGVLPLREEIAKKLSRDYDLEVDPKNQVITGCGGKQILMLALSASLNPGDEVIIPAPYWVSYPDMTVLAQGTPVIVPCPLADNFKLTPDNLAAHITPKSRWLIINSPSNPTGELYSTQELTALMNVVAKHPNLGIISDDIYEHLTYDDKKFTPITTLANDQDLLNRMFIANGFSKTFCMTGWRLGWGAGHPDLIKAMTLLVSQSTSQPSSLAQYAGIAALQHPLDFLVEFKERFVARRNLVVEALNNMPGIECRKPSGAFYVYPHCAGVLGKRTRDGATINSDSDLAAYLLDEAGVAIVPGAAFGLEPFLRISYAASDVLLQQAMRAMHDAIEKLLPKT